MEVIHPRCGGLDVHKETVVACVRLVMDGKTTREVRTFETTTSGLLLLLAWLTELGCTHVAMEATGVYWKPVWNKLAALADRRIKASPQELREALRGRVTNHHRFLLHLHLQHIEFADAAIQDIDRNVTALIPRMDQEVEAGQTRATFQSLISLLIAIPGIDMLSARIILSEIGLDMSRFPTAGHLLSWAGLCPRNDESAGKRRSTRLRKGDLRLKTLLVRCAWAAKRKKGSYFNAQFFRICGRRGPKKAACAVAASLLTTIYHMLKDGTQFQDLGADHFDRQPKEVRAKRLVVQRRVGEDPVDPLLGAKTWLRRQAHAPRPSGLRL
jgi:transposase